MKDDITVSCPGCGEDVYIGEGIYAGDVVSCPDCYAELKIVKLNPPRIEEVKDDFEEEDDRDETDGDPEEDEYSG